ncbi:MAG: hypothetical protein ACE5FD_02250 [Anaerolineae bacterium]
MMGHLQVGNVSVDGSKIHADASKSKAVSYKRLLTIEAYLQAEVKKVLAARAQARYEAEKAEYKPYRLVNKALMKDIVWQCGRQALHLLPVIFTAAIGTNDRQVQAARTAP